MSNPPVILSSGKDDSFADSFPQVYILCLDASDRLVHLGAWIDREAAMQTCAIANNLLIGPYAFLKEIPLIGRALTLSELERL